MQVLNIVSKYFNLGEYQERCNAEELEGEIFFSKELFFDEIEKIISPALLSKALGRCFYITPEGLQKLYGYTPEFLEKILFLTSVKHCECTHPRSDTYLAVYNMIDAKKSFDQLWPAAESLTQEEIELGFE